MKPKVKVKAIILDLDGTLVDSREAYREALIIVFTKLGKKRFDEALVTEIPRRFEQNMSLNDLLGGVDEEAFRKVYLKAYYDATASLTKPFSGATDALEKLSRKAMLTLTTRRYVPKKELVGQLEKLGLAKYFKCVTTGQGGLKPKPSPDAVLDCSRQLNVKVSDCLVVGDSVVDIQAGRNAGAKTAAVLSGIFSRKELERERPDLILQSVVELPDFIE